MLEVNRGHVAALLSGIWMALHSGTVLRAWWCGNLYGGMVCWLCFGDWLGRLVAQPHPCWSQAAASRTVPWLLPRGKQSVSSKGEHTTCSQMWMTGDQVLGLNRRIKLSNRTDVALVPFPSLRSESPASVQMRPPVINIVHSVWNCSAGTILFLSLFLLLSFHLFSLPFFFLSSHISCDLLAQTFLLSLFLSSFSQVHIAPLHLSQKKDSLCFAILPPTGFPFCPTFSCSCCFRQQHCSQLTFNAEAHAIDIDGGTRKINYTVKSLQMICFLWSRWSLEEK